MVSMDFATRFRFLVRFFFATFLLFCSSSKAHSQNEQQPTIRFVRNPEPAPAFTLNDLGDKPLSIEAFRGKVILLNFWATWCGPCRAEIPDLIELQKKYGGRLQIIGLVVDEDEKDPVKKFADEFQINYPVALTPTPLRISYGGIAALPTSFLIDTEGRIVQKHEGLRNPLLYETEIRSLLGLSIGNVRVETFEDVGQIFIKHADRASELPGVDLTKLTPEQRIVALHKFNEQMCSCGCGYTLAQCRIYDHNCGVSKSATEKIIADLSGADAESLRKEKTKDEKKPSEVQSKEKQPAEKTPGNQKN
jgi:cytochrome c biogenesis protein CcmG/thiol:disulfide interchange protein DsbE